MGKGGKNKRRRGDNATNKDSSSSGGGWTGTDHALRQAKHEDRLLKKFKGKEEKLSFRERRAATLGHDSQDKIDASKLRLHITKTERQLQQYRQRLEQWDDVEEDAKRRHREAEEAKRQQDEQEESTKPKKKKGRLGPETWKLRGAARPAWEVYDFDTRYVDPHIQAHEEAKRKAKRCRNILVLYKGKFGAEQQTKEEEEHKKKNALDAGPPQPTCREFLALLMQWGMLCLQAKKYKSARQAFLECLEYDGIDQPITTARCQLMRLYMESNRPESARRLWEQKLHPMDPSVWIRYSAALLDYVSWNLLKEKGSTKQIAYESCVKAIQSNVFAAYQLVYHSTFQRVMEYTEDIQDAIQPLEEAIEYCHSEQMGAWLGTDGAIEFLKYVLLKLLHHDASPSTAPSTDKNDNDTSSNKNSTNIVREWNSQLAQIEQDYEEEQRQWNQNIGGGKDYDEKDSNNRDEDIEDEEEEQDETADTLMYAGMFRTAMDMLEDAGEFIPRETPESDSDDDDEEAEAEEEEGADGSDANENDDNNKNEGRGKASKVGNNSDSGDSDSDSS